MESDKGYTSPKDIPPSILQSLAILYQSITPGCALVVNIEDNACFVNDEGVSPSAGYLVIHKPLGKMDVDIRMTQTD